MSASNIIKNFFLFKFLSIGLFVESTSPAE